MIAALIIAAGQTAKKIGFEPEKEVGTISALQRIALVFQRAGVELIVVVCDNEQERAAAHMGLIFLHSQEQADMLDNVKLGLSYLKDRCTSAFVTHTDVPLFSVETVRTLMAAEGCVRAPAYQGRVGHPILLEQESFQDILSYQGQGGLADAIRTAGLCRRILPVEDAGILTDIQEDTDYADLVEHHDLSALHFDFQLRLMKEKPFYGPGPHQLLQLTEETGSLLEACRRMGISYSKGRNIVALIEQQTGSRVIEGRQGGKTGGYSIVTAAGQKLMKEYASFRMEAKQLLDALFQKHFSDCAREGFPPEETNAPEP